MRESAHRCDWCGKDFTVRWIGVKEKPDKARKRWREEPEELDVVCDECFETGEGKMTDREYAEEGWKLASQMTKEMDKQDAEVGKLKAEVDRLKKVEAAVVKHHAQKADDRCWADDNELYQAAGLPLHDDHVGDPAAMLENCKRFIVRRCSGGVWPSYADLEKELSELREWRSNVSAALKSLPEFNLGEWAGSKEGWGYHRNVIRWMVLEMGCGRPSELKVENARLKTVLEIVAGSVKAAMEKMDDAPMSAVSHLDEASEILAGEVQLGEKYSKEAAEMRGVLVQSLVAKRTLIDSGLLVFGPNGTIDESQPLPVVAKLASEKILHLRKLHNEMTQEVLKACIQRDNLIGACKELDLPFDQREKMEELIKTMKGTS